MMECGQYNEQWAHIHMMPEEMIIASKDLNARLVIPIHWGAFKLALHAWNDPIIRASQAASEANIELTSPIVGEPLILGSESHPKSVWWSD